MSLRLGFQSIYDVKRHQFFRRQNATYTDEQTLLWFCLVNNLGSFVKLIHLIWIVTHALKRRTIKTGTHKRVCIPAL